MSDQQEGTPKSSAPQNAAPSPEPEEASPPAETSEAPAQTAPSAAAAPSPAPPPGRFWDRPSRRTLFIVMAVFGVWAITATAFALAGQSGHRFHGFRGSMDSKRYGGMMGDSDRYRAGFGGGMMNGGGYGGGMMNGGGGMIACPNGVYVPNGSNPSNAPIPPAAPTGSPGQTIQLGPCRMTLPSNWNGWSPSGSSSSPAQGTTTG